MSDQQAQDSVSGPSPVPVLGEGFQETPPPSEDKTTSEGTDPGYVDSKTGKRRFWGLGKRRDDEKAKKKKDASESSSSSMKITKQPPTMQPTSPPGHGGNIPTLANVSSHPYSPSSPVRNLNTSSPAPPSPASSQIFERHVQEDILTIPEQAPIPGHIATENHIPPVLDASSEAITNEELNPNNVEIVMHSAHHPASLTVVGEAPGPTMPDEYIPIPDGEDGSSNYGALDSTDVRRLSFISFADVVHSEHTHDGGSIATGMISPVVSQNRSPSPIRSPLSSQGLGGSPNLSGSVSSKGRETSPNRAGRSLASPLPGHSPPLGGELTIETMRQALRKTGSGDLSGGRSLPMSATSDNEENAAQAFK
ncbi:uncharacterized protein KY384_006073 [Bacidia gigantensis]|uniref:uncharacterized protein n=1 Tax=Bacidia gigantensis TaxID=2732470 RepID=UPI001D053370|nr:uncharacterized protein KY384_006073 [Bacidia gigantensis]KAG8529436.1 hypothetical protein KY384_006073 [Bacidia gigantensis]